MPTYLNLKEIGLKMSILSKFEKFVVLKKPLKP